MKKYNKNIEAEMRTFFQTLSEKDKRQYAALEARKLGYGGQTYIAAVLNISRKTIERGLAELISDNPPPVDGVRRKGGGRKPFDKKNKR